MILRLIAHMGFTLVQSVKLNFLGFTGLTLVQSVVHRVHTRPTCLTEAMDCLEGAEQDLQQLQMDQ